MPMRIVVFGREGDGAAQAAVTQIRALVRELKCDAGVQIVTDESMMRSNGVEDPPAIQLDGMFISNGWVPSRGEIARALNGRMAALNPQIPAGPQLAHKKKNW